MAKVATRKVTISLPEDLISFADSTAAARRTSRSSVIGDLLAKLRAREVERLAREGYEFYGREGEDFARASGSAVAEALDDDSPAR